jgi:hypothetical protein
MVRDDLCEVFLWQVIIVKLALENLEEGLLQLEKSIHQSLGWVANK